MTNPRICASSTKTNQTRSQEVVVSEISIAVAGSDIYYRIIPACALKFSKYKRPTHLTNPDVQSRNSIGNS